MTAGEAYFHVKVDEGSDPLRIVASGELDAASAPALAKEFAALQSASHTIELDLGGVTFIDSSGLRVIAAEVRRAGERGVELVVTAASDPVRRIFEMTGLTALITS